ncbi:hypothetical protein B0H13DRAFT_1873979 [Mycena leptocephala]|nr:hypothetical protein B0H13DRAFT_1873979 [Mycena leptocephala]
MLGKSIVNSPLVLGTGTGKTRGFPGRVGRVRVTGWEEVRPSMTRTLPAVFKGIYGLILQEDTVDTAGKTVRVVDPQGMGYAGKGPGGDFQTRTRTCAQRYSPPGIKFYPDRETSLASFYSDLYFGAPLCPPANLRLMPRLKPATAKSHCSDTPLRIVIHSVWPRRYRSRTSDVTTSTGGVSELRLRACASGAKYRETHRDKIREADKLWRAKLYISAHGAEAFDEKQDHPHLVKTQRRHEGRPPPRRPGLSSLPRKPRFNPHEVLTENQKRCRALRWCGFEEDNGEDSDVDLPPGICGCEQTECQRMHKNETKDRKDWKTFHLKYAKEIEAGF